MSVYVNADIKDGGGGQLMEPSAVADTIFELQRVGRDCR